MTSQKYKDLSVKEFTKAAEIYESNYASVYKMCKKDYPDFSGAVWMITKLLKKEAGS